MTNQDTTDIDYIEKSGDYNPPIDVEVDKQFATTHSNKTAPNPFYQDTTSIDEVREIEKLLKLPHIQEFYDWCNEEDIPEDIMYKIAGWLCSEIYFVPANVAVIIQKHISDQVTKARIDELEHIVSGSEYSEDDFDWYEITRDEYTGNRYYSEVRHLSKQARIAELRSTQ